MRVTLAAAEDIFDPSQLDDDGNPNLITKKRDEITAENMVVIAAAGIEKLNVALQFGGVFSIKATLALHLYGSQEEE